MVEAKEKEPAYKFRRRIRLTGIRELKGTQEDGTAVIWCSGPTFSAYDDDKIPEDWARFSVNETIKRDWDGWHGRNPEYWVLSDLPVVEKFAKHCPKDTTILAMHRSTETISKVCPKHKIFTVNSLAEIKDFDNGYEFFSRRTVMIGAVEMARYMGFKRFFVFGLDLFRIPSKYYYDGKDAIWMGERRSPMQFMIRGKNIKHEGQRIFQTPNLRAGRMMLSQIKQTGLWSGIEIHVVGSPHSQQDAISKMTHEEFDAILRKETVRKKSARKEKGDLSSLLQSSADKARKIE